MSDKPPARAHVCAGFLASRNRENTEMLARVLAVTWHDRYSRMQTWYDLSAGNGSFCVCPAAPADGDGRGTGAFSEPSSLPHGSQPMMGSHTAARRGLAVWGGGS